MGIETQSEYGGAESSFTSAIVAIEELARIDPSVSVLCDVHNTLVNTIFRKHGTPDQQKRFLPLLSEGKVRQPYDAVSAFVILPISSGPSVCLSQYLAQTPLLSKHAQKSSVNIISSTVPKCGLQTLTKPISS